MIAKFDTVAGFRPLIIPPVFRERGRVDLSLPREGGGSQTDSASEEVVAFATLGFNSGHDVPLLGRKSP